MKLNAKIAKYWATHSWIDIYLDFAKYFASACILIVTVTLVFKEPLAILTIACSITTIIGLVKLLTDWLGSNKRDYLDY
jgi:hypothetical protein